MKCFLKILAQNTHSIFSYYHPTNSFEALQWISYARLPIIPLCLIVVNKAPKRWLIKTCPSQITASFTNNSIFVLIHVEFFTCIWLHLSFGDTVSLWQDWFEYFWTLHVECWLALNCLWYLSSFYWAEWQQNQLCIPSVWNTNSSPELLWLLLLAKLLKGWGAAAFILAACHCLDTLYGYFNC